MRLVESNHDRLRARLEQGMSEQQHHHRQPQRVPIRQSQRRIAQHEQRDSRRKRPTRAERTIHRKPPGSVAK